MINKKRLISEFIKLVKIKSISKEEKNVAVFIKNILQRDGFKVYLDKANKQFNGNCGNIYTFIEATDKNKPSILLNAHIDTVLHDDQIRPIIQKNIIKSNEKSILGADCKAGVAAIIEVLRVMKREKFLHGKIIVCFTVAEEIGLLGAKHVEKNRIKADYGLVVDGGSVNQIINKAPSQVSISATIIGKAAHAGVKPEKGINAIKVASEAISKMPLGRIDKETTANIGVIKGGVATNIVPERVEIKGEVRSHSLKKLKNHTNLLMRYLSLACKKHKASLKVKIEPVYEKFEINENSDFVKIVKKSVKQVGLSPKIKMTGGGSDANIFNKLGIPCLILGVGAHNVHTSKEYISINDLVHGTELLLTIIKNLNEVYAKKTD